MATAFDNDKYIRIQSEHIRERIAQFGNKLYLELGGKLFDDLHASRVLPGFMPDSKLQMLTQLQDSLEIIIVISADDIGITGFALKKMLFDEYDVEVELPDYRNVVAIVTYANEQNEIDKLVEALEDISRRFSPEGEPLPPGEKLPPQPDYVLSPRAAYFLERERVPWVETRGRIVAEMIAPYPPGIPVIYQGERMSAEVWDYIEAFRQRNGHIHGPSDPTLSTLLVIKE